MNDTKTKLLKEIQRMGPGAAFSAKDFLRLAQRDSIDKAISNLAYAGVIRRIGHGLYDYPRASSLLKGVLPPDVDKAAQAVARKFGWRIVPDGVSAANLLGLSTQVPSQSVYLSDGPSRTMRIGNRQIRFKHADPKFMHVGSPKTNLIIQALRHLGQDAIDEVVLARLRDATTTKERRQLIEESRYAADWIYAVARRIAKGVA